MLISSCAVLVLVLAPAPLRLPELLDEVGARAPEVGVAAADVEVSRAAIGVAGAWDDAALSVMADGLPLPGGVIDDIDPPMILYRLGQPLNLFGRRGAAKRAARAVVARDRATLRRTAWDARAQAAALFYELWMNGEMVRIVDAQVALLDRMRDAALARVRAGMDMGHHDVLRAESELAAMAAERASLDDERTAIVAMLNTLRGRDPGDELGTPELPADPALPDVGAAVAAAARSPEVEAAGAMRDEAAARRELARKMYLPMVMVEAQYEQNLRGMPDGFGVGLSISIPLWWDRPRNEVRMARAMERAAEREQTATRTMATAEARMAWSRARAGERTVEALDRAAIPKLKQTIQSIEAAYVGGRGDFLALLDAIMALRQLEARRTQAVAARGIARFELDRIAGRGVTR